MGAFLLVALSLTAPKLRTCDAVLHEVMQSEAMANHPFIGVKQQGPTVGALWSDYKHGAVDLLLFAPPDATVTAESLTLKEKCLTPSGGRAVVYTAHVHVQGQGA